MKILMVSYYDPYSNDGGGMEQVIRELVDHLKEKIVFDILCISTKNFVRKMANNVRVIGLNVRTFEVLGGKEVIIRKPLYNSKVKEFITEQGYEYDIIHVHGDVGGFSELSKVNTILTLHGFSMQVHQNRNLIDRLFIRLTSARTEIRNMKFSNKITVVSRQVKNFAKKYTQKPIKVVYNGIDTKFYAPLSIEEKAKIRCKLGFKRNITYILFVGGDPYRKGLDIALDAIKRVKRVKLIVIGNYPKQNMKTHSFVGKMAL